jgi:hypothetical protein
MASPVDLCPLDARRTETEVFVKRLAVSLTVLCLAAHLSALRGAKGSGDFPRGPLLLYLTFFNPLFPLVTLLVNVVWAAVRRRFDARWGYGLLHQGRAEPPAGFYLAAAMGAEATHPEEPGLGGVGKGVTSLALLHLPPAGAVRVPRKRPAGANALGRLVLLAFAAVQCVSTVVLGVRRLQRGASAPLDLQPLMFALGGVAILAQSSVLEVMSCRFTADDQAARRPRTQDERLSVGFTIGEVCLYVLSLVLVLCLTGDGGHAAAMVSVAWLWLVLAAYPWTTMMEDWFPFTGVAQSGRDLFAALKQLQDGSVPRQRAMGEIRAELKMMGMMFLLWLMILFPLAVGAFGGWVYFLISYGAASDHFTDGEGNPVSTTEPCPLLWKDPLADMLWAF